MELNTQKLHTDIIRKLYKENITLKSLCYDLNFSSYVITSVRLGKNIKVNNLLKITTWLGNGVDTYVKQTKPQA